jgi:hemerythrin
MAFYEWNDKLLLNQSSIDNQHKKLVNLINELYDAMGTGSAKDKMGKILNELISYTKTHFGDEEKTMELNNYPGIGVQKAQHQAFVEKIESTYAEFQKGNNYLSVAVMNFLKDWLNKHIMDLDQQLGAFLAAKK